MKIIYCASRHYQVFDYVGKKNLTLIELKELIFVWFFTTI